MARYRAGVEADFNFNYEWIHEAIAMGVGMSCEGYDPNTLTYYFTNWMGDEVVVIISPINEFKTNVYIESEQGMETLFNYLNKTSQEQNADIIFEGINHNLEILISWYGD